VYAEGVILSRGAIGGRRRPLYESFGGFDAKKGKKRLYYFREEERGAEIERKNLLVPKGERSCF